MILDPEKMSLEITAIIIQTETERHSAVKHALADLDEASEVYKRVRRV